MEQKYTNTLALSKLNAKKQNVFSNSINNIGLTVWEAAKVTRGSRTGPIFEGGTTALRIDYGY